MNSTKVEIIEVDMQRIDQLIERLERTDLSAEDRETVENILLAYVQLLGMIKDKNTSIQRLKKLLFGAPTEKLESVLKDQDQDQDPSEDAAETPSASAESPTSESADPSSSTDGPASAAPGHGRNGADAYVGAEKTWVPHPSLSPGDFCPKCQEGTVYEWPRPGILVRLVGQPPVKAKVYRLEKLRCGLCGTIFTAPAPEGVGPDKYDATTISTIALLKYGTGLPFNRLQRLEANYGIPLPASTQWEIVRDGALRIVAAHGQLIREAAQGEIIHNDDTSVKILDLMRQNVQQDPSLRRGMFTSGIVSIEGGRKIALFFSGRKHAGENLADVLAQRAKALGPAIQMCDALSRNLPDELETILGNCLAHGRRKFVDIVEAFPVECRYVLEALRDVYRIDAEARQQNLSRQERLRLHERESGPVMDRLHAWLQEQLDERRVEPNSALGQAMRYMLNHWKPLTLFLRQPGAPLDNNICERALKKAIMHRRNSLFFKTQNGADVGDIFMSLIYTCELNEVNPADYLTELQRHAEQLSANPADWMPWTYRRTLDRLAADSHQTVS